MRHINLSNKNMKEINIKSKANKIGKWFEGIGKKIMSIDLIDGQYRDWETDRKSTRLNSSHITRSRMPSSA